VFSLSADVATSGIQGTEDFAQLTLVVKECVAGRCRAASTFTEDLSSAAYSESADLSLTTVLAHVGSLGIGVEWVAPPGWGRRAGTAATRAPARATLLVGRWIEEADGFSVMTRCITEAGRVASSVVVTAGSPRRPARWADTPPSGLRLSTSAKRAIRCA
jgi:hypothetical protein